MSSDPVTRGIIEVLDAANKRVDMSYELHGMFRLIANVAPALTERPEIIKAI